MAFGDLSPAREEKRRLRALLKERLRNVSPAEWAAISAAVCGRLAEDPFYLSAGAVFCFVGTEGEVDTRPFLKRVLRDGKTLAVPRCGPGGRMTARIITDLSCLRAGFFGLPEPPETSPVLPREETDLAVVPCLGADPEGYRLGRGGGYYDRYLDGFPGHSLLLCPRCALLPRVPREAFDLRAERLITDRPDPSHSEEVFFMYKPAPAPIQVPEDLLALSRPAYDADGRALARVLRRAIAGEALTIALIGGSITMGTVSVGSADERFPGRECYAEWFFSWWKETFPACRFTFVNAGIGGTDSYLGVHRAAEDVLSRAPDLVLAEFSVNDDGSEFTRCSYDSLVRTLLKGPSSPAVMLLFMGQTNGTTAQEAHRTVAAGYRLPSVSCADVFMAMIRGGVHTAKELSGDEVHPSALGHRVTAALLIDALSRALAGCSALPDPVPFTLPPVTGERYPRCRIDDCRTARVLSAGSFREGSSLCEFYKNGWTHAGPDGEGITFEEDCARLGILYLKTVDGKSGKAAVLVDGVQTAVLDGDFTGGWGNAISAREVLARDLQGPHTVTVRPLDGGFILLGLLVTEKPE